MNFNAIKSKAVDFFNEAKFISHIESDEDYANALKLMDEVIDNYETYRPLIDVLSLSVERWENEAEYFSEFNQRIAKLETGVAVLRTLMDQHELTAADLKNEIGGKSLVSLILSGSRNLTLDHINALSDRFNLNPAVFLSKGNSNEQRH